MTRQVAVVTGAARGIGLAAARALADEGFSVAMNGLPDDPELPEAVAKLRAAGADAIAVPFDVADLSAHDGAFRQVADQLGPPTTLVNNAGVGVVSRGDILDVTEASFDRCIRVNAKAMFFLSQCFARRVLGQDRSASLVYSIVNVTSANAVAVAAPRSEYGVSKAAAAMVSKAFAVRLGSEDIAVYDVQPGLIATEMTQPVIESYQQRARDGLTLFPRVGQPEEVGRIIASLAAGRLPYTTGQVISADAGLLVSRF